MQGRLSQVIFAHASLDRMEYEEMAYDEIIALASGEGTWANLIRARDLTGAEKRSFHKRRR